MTRNLTEVNWKQLRDDVKRRLGKLVDDQRELWSGKRDRSKPMANRQAQQQTEPPK
jgi:uncharacterized protein YjbJ (UPF0337 family)